MTDGDEPAKALETKKNVLGAPVKRPLSKLPADTMLAALADALNWCSKCLESGRSRLLLKFHLHYVSRRHNAVWNVSVGREC